METETPTTRVALVAAVYAEGARRAAPAGTWRASDASSADDRARGIATLNVPTLNAEAIAAHLAELGALVWQVNAYVVRIKL